MPPKPKQSGTKILLIVLPIVAVVVIGLAVTAFLVLRSRFRADDSLVNKAQTEESTEQKPKKKRQEEEAEVEEVEEEIEEVVEELPPVPYAEEQGFDFVDPYTSDFYFPCFLEAMYYNDEGVLSEPVEPELTECSATDCEYRFRPFTKTAADENGNVRIIIPYDVNCMQTCVDKGVEKNYRPMLNWRMFRLYDYYTGQQIVFSGNYDRTYEMDPVYTEIEWMGETIRIGMASYEEWNGGNYEQTGKTGEGFPIFQAEADWTMYYCVTVPADYDGLMLVGYKEGDTEEITHMDPLDDGKGRTVLGPDIYNRTYMKDDLVMIKVDDHITQTAPADFVVQHNMLIMPTGTEVTAEVMKIKSEKDTDESYYMPTNCYVSESIEDCEPGMKKVTGYYTLDYSEQGSGAAFEAWVDAFDRYTGTSFMSGSPLTINSKNKTTELEEPITISTPSGPVEIFMETSSKMDKKNKLMTRTITVTCPVDYDGTVFMVGYSSRALASELDFEGMAARQMTIDSMPFYKSRKPYYFFNLDGI